MNEELLAKLCCPVSRATLVRVGDWLYSTDRTTRRKYPIRDGLPIMLGVVVGMTLATVRFQKRLD